MKVYPLFFCGLLFTSLFAVSATPAGALLISRDDVPSAVTSAFEGAHPKATVKGYRQTERDGATVYEIEVMEGTTRRDFVYSPDGTLLAIEEPISPSLLPDPVRRSLSINYPDYRIVAAERHRKGTAVEYGAVIRRGKKRLEVLFDKGGNILKSTRPQ